MTEFEQMFFKAARKNLGIKKFYKVPYKGDFLKVEQDECIKIFGREAFLAKIESGEITEF